MARPQSVNLQRRTNRDLAAFSEDLRGWLAERGGRLRTVESVVDARYVEGAGTANETITATCILGEGGAARQDIVVRLTVPTIAAYLDLDLQRQADTVAWVGAHTSVPVPQVFAIDTDGAAFDAPFIVFERLRGQVPSDFPPYNSAGFLHDMAEADRRQLWRSAMAALCEVHRADATSIDFLPGTPATGLGELVDYWARTFDWVLERTPLDQLRPFLDWVQTHLPDDSPRGLSWGDARLGNMMFDGTRCTGVLDWEMASLGGPMVDLSWWLMFDINHSTDNGTVRLPGLGDRAETIALWEELTGLRAVNLEWHQVFSLLQLALLRANAFEGRARLGLPVPGDDDPRSVARLVTRMQRILTDGGE